MLYIIGLGNPGEKYHYTRHNVAWLVFDELLSEDWHFQKYMNAEINDDGYGMYIKPHTFMNNSGEVIAYLKKHEPEFNRESMVIIYDDIDLPFGTIKISYDRGDGGHNGIKSIIEHDGARDWTRIRVGISRLLDDGRIIKPNVLGVFPENERQIIKNEVAPKVGEIIKSLAEQGLDKTMNIFNTK